MHQQMMVEEGWQTALAITEQRGLSPATAYTQHSRHRQLCLPGHDGAPLEGGLGLLASAVST